MLILGVETSCDETACAVVRDGREVLSSVVASQERVHAPYGGVVPELAGRAHVEEIDRVVRLALTRAGITKEDIDAVAVGNRPGLIGSLVVGVSAAKALAWALGVPLVGVDHVHAHLFSASLRDAGAEQNEDLRDDSLFPALGLVVSGGHTALYKLLSWTRVERLGGTIDDAMGEAFDKVAAILGLGHPGGVAVDALSQEVGADDRAFVFPVSRLGADSLDFSFSGLKTAVLYAVRGVPQGGTFERDAAGLSHEEKRGVAASFQRAAVRAVLLKLARAAQGNWARTLLVGGGVSANSRLRSELLAFQGAGRVLLPKKAYCVDNAAMIAGLAFHLMGEGRVDDLSLRATPTI